MMRANIGPSGRRRGMLPAVFAGGVALVVGLVCGGLVLNPGDGTRPEPPPAEPAPSNVEPPDPETPPRVPSQSTGAGGQRLPPDLDFAPVAGVRLPVSTSAGPGESVDGLARGFARDRVGVALAAVHILVRVHPEVGADVFAPTLAGQVVGPEAQVLHSNVEHAYAQLLHQWPVVYGQPAGSLHFAVPGFQVDQFTADEASVRLLLEVPDRDGVLLGVTELRMRWHHNDWALVAPDDGAFTATSLVEDTAGFTLWQPETGS